MEHSASGGGGGDAQPAVSMFARGTGVHWCEPKYTVHGHIAEFANTVSNVPIVLVPLAFAYAIRPYTESAHGNRAVLAPVLASAGVGLASALYHGTLSLFAQIVDELSILWVIAGTLYTMLPVFESVRRAGLAKHVTAMRCALAAVTLVATPLSFVVPQANAFALLSLSIPCSVLIYKEGTYLADASARRLPALMLCVWLAAVACWLADRLLCPALLQLGVTYMHGAFHCLAAYAVYVSHVLMLYVDATARGWRVDVRHFPRGTGVPYVRFEQRWADL